MKDVTPAELSKAEADRLQQCEQVIERGIKTFVEVGNALTEVRDGKLYRATHKTFEAYCKQRWEISRPRAYELMGQAEVAGALSDAGVNLSDASDISTRQMRELKKDLPAAATEIRERVEAGEEPAKAIAEVAKPKPAPEPQPQPAAPKVIEATAEPVPDEPEDDEDTQALKDRIAELEEYQQWADKQIADLKAENALYADMKVEYEQGGFAKVIAGKDEVISVQATRIERESDDKVSYMNEAKRYRKILDEKYHHFDRTAIDVETGEFVHG